jgi:DNA (cytosine-5)-methyltransferase 1
MAKAGAMVIEWGLLDAQHFGIPQRRRRVFVIAIFNSATASNCPNPLLPLSESLPRDTAKGKPKRKSATNTLTEGSGTGGFRMRGFGDYADDDTASAIKQRDYKDATDLVVSKGFTSSSFAQYQEGVGTLRSNGGDLGGGSETLIAEPMLLDIQRVGDIRVYSQPVQSLQARMGTGGNSTPMLAFDTQFGSNANVFENQSPTLKASQAAPSVAYDEYNDSINETHYALRAGTKQSTGVLESTMAVRRLTPLECERLMGWPDDHTRYKADGTEQADTHRYKQCGNGVASPVAEWIGKQLMKLSEVPS